MRRAARRCALALRRVQHCPRHDVQDFGQIERGRNLATLADCAACHTSQDGGKPFAGGRRSKRRSATCRPNITPDRETGIGTWSDDDFDNAVRHGTEEEGSRLYPAMPYPYYTKMSRDDVNGDPRLSRYLTAVHNEVMQSMPFPFNIRWS